MAILTIKAISRRSRRLRFPEYKWRQSRTSEKSIRPRLTAKGSDSIVSLSSMRSIRLFLLPDINFSSSYFATSRTAANFFSVITLSAIEFSSLLSEQNATPMPACFTIQMSFSLSPIAMILANGILYFFDKSSSAFDLQKLCRQHTLVFLILQQLQQHLQQSQFHRQPRSIVPGLILSAIGQSAL